MRVLCVLCVLALAVGVIGVDITLDASKSVHPVSPNLWGIFYEEINHAAVGGLYSQLIQNPLFQSNTLSPWTSSGGCTITLDATQPLNTVNKNALAASIGTSTDCVLTNSGYYGIAAKPGANYSLSFYVLLQPTQPVESLTLTAGLKASSGASVYAEEEVTVDANSKWQKFSTEFTVDDGVKLDPNAVFYLSLPASSSAVKIWIQCVLLFPGEDWHGLQYIRKDLGDMLEAMHPTFMRFPGGNYVEGNNIQQIMRWKDTVGPVEERPGHQGTWGYFSPDHFGFLEELVFMETLGVEPIWVVNCGMTFGGMVPLDQLQPYIQDVLDGIEFVTGPADSVWGAKRAALGHEKPFKLSYVAFGNEEDLNGYLPDYKLRYPLFYKAVSAAYPQMHLIANTIQVQSAGTVQIQEVHQYNTPEVFYGEAHQYDNTDRSVPIFLSEYAVAGTWSQKNNTQNYYALRAALGEAVFMTMLERNSDLVIMACYAPLFVASQNHAWDPNAIIFDSYRAYGSPSYWNQVMFGSHPGQDVLAINFDDKANLLQISATSRATATQATYEIILKCVNYGETNLTSHFTVTLPAAARRTALGAKATMRHHHCAKHALKYANPAAGTWTLSSSVLVTTLTAKDQFATNSFDAPTAIVPQETEAQIKPVVVDAMHVKFDYVFPAYAVQILVLSVNLD